MKKTVTWILVADGAQAQVFEHGGPGKGMTAIRELHFEEEHLKAQDIMADKPGRSFSSAGPGARSAMEYSSDPVQVREERFVKALAEKLETLRQEGRFDRLIIAAAPSALGDIRPALSDGVKQAVIAELPKDLTNIPQPQLDRHFDQLLA